MANRQKATEYLLKQVAKIDKHCNADNVGRLKKQFDSMSDSAFDKYMKNIRDKKACDICLFT